MSEPKKKSTLASHIKADGVAWDAIFAPLAGWMIDNEVHTLTVKRKGVKFTVNLDAR